MSSLWTPDGERPVGKPASGGVPPAPAGSAPPSGGSGGSGGSGAAGGAPPASPDDEQLAEQVEAMQRELANAPVEVVVANHCYGLFELAAVYLSQAPPLLPQARLAIDALACMVDGLKGRLGEAEGPLKEGLSQLQLAYVQIDAAQRAGEQAATAAGANGASEAADPPDAADAPDTPATDDHASDATADPAAGGTESRTEAEPGG